MTLHREGFAFQMASGGAIAAHAMRGGGISGTSQTVAFDARNAGSTSFSFSLSNDGLSMSFSGGNSFSNSEESTTVNGVRTAYEAINSTHSSHSMSLGFDYEAAFVIFVFNPNASSSQG